MMFIFQANMPSPRYLVGLTREKGGKVNAELTNHMPHAKLFHDDRDPDIVYLTCKMLEQGHPVIIKPAPIVKQVDDLIDV